MISRIISILLLLMTSFRSSSQYAATENIKLVWENILDLKDLISQFLDFSSSRFVLTLISLSYPHLV